MCEQSLTKHAVHQRNVVKVAFAVGIDGEHLVKSPCKRAMVKNHVGTAGDTCTVLARRATFAHAEAHVADDDVVGARERHTVAIDGNTLTRCCLSGHIKILGEDDAA